jgi:pre-mRNA-processing factor SLU7
VVQDVSLDWDGKRDRWNGYDATEHMRLVDEWETLEEEKRKRKAQELDRADTMTNEVAAKMARTEPAALSDVDSDSDDGEKYAEQEGPHGQKFDAKTRITVRNLRIREDTAKYLLNLDESSAYYDPKTRSMRQHPNPMNKDAAFKGDNFERYTGDAARMASLQRYAWDAEKRGFTNINLEANPTLGEIMHKKYMQDKDKAVGESKLTILEQYGGQEHLAHDMPRELLLAQSEHYVEYDRTGAVIKGQERAIAKSRYEEDVHPNNHTSVWGSYWKDGEWGYQCCHSTLKNSYCVPVERMQQATMQ